MLIATNLCPTVDQCDCDDVYHHKLYIWLQRRHAERLVIMSIRHVSSNAEAKHVDPAGNQEHAR